MSLIKWEPLPDIERFFDEGFLSFAKFGRDLAIDVYEKDDRVTAEINMPGVDPEHIEVTVEGNYLRVSGSREESKEEKKKHYYSKEISRGSFERIVRLPTSVDKDQVKAEFKNGELIVSMPKKAETESGKIKVEVKK